MDEVGAEPRADARETRRSPTIPIRTETRIAAPRPTKRLRGSVLPGSRASCGQVGDRLEARVGEHRHRQRERERVPGRRDARVRAARQVGRAEQEHEPEDDQDHRRDERDDGHHDRDPVEARPADQPQERDRQDHEDGGDDVPRVLRDPDPPDRVAEVVRDEERGERDHDRVVEEQHPARQEAGRVVEGAAGEHRRAAGLGQRGRALGVRERDEEEEQADGEQHPRRQPERVERDDPEREVDRGADLAVGDRGERLARQAADEPWQAARH